MADYEGVVRRVSQLEKREEQINNRLTNLHTKIDTNKEVLERDIKEISATLKQIESGQHSQALINQKMDFTLERINQDRISENKQKEELKKETKNDMKQMKYLFIGMVGTIGTSLLVSLIRMWFGI